MLTSKKNLFADFGVSKPTLTELEKLEDIIARGKQSFVEVGEALMQVRDKKLYTERYGTFAEYCEQRWGFKKSHVYRLMEASEEALKLPEPERPKTEKEARKVLKIRRTSPRGDIQPKKEIVMDRITPEDQAAELFADIEERIRDNRENLKFLQALDKWLKESGL